MRWANAIRAMTRSARWYASCKQPSHPRGEIFQVVPPRRFSLPRLPLAAYYVLKKEQPQPVYVLYAG